MKHQTALQQSGEESSSFWGNGIKATVKDKSTNAFY